MKTKILKVFFGSFPTLAERNQQTQSLKPNTSLLLSFCTYPISKLDILQKEKHAQPFAEIDTGLALAQSQINTPVFFLPNAKMIK